MTAKPGRNEPAIRLPEGRDGKTAEEVERSFQAFRVNAVRLVEHVNDVMGPPADAASGRMHGDLRLARSIFGKWAADILLALHSAPSVGFEELRRSLPGISPRVLSLKLKELEQNGMVHREIIDMRPPRVRYALTQRGWTVAWLAQPIFLYLRLTQERTSESEAPIAEGAVPAGAAP